MTGLAAQFIIPRLQSPPRLIATKEDNRDVLYPEF